VVGDGARWAAEPSDPTERGHDGSPRQPTKRMNWSFRFAQPSKTAFLLSNLRANRILKYGVKTMRVPVSMRSSGSRSPRGESPNQPFRLSSNSFLPIAFQGSRGASRGRLILSTFREQVEHDRAAAVSGWVANWEGEPPGAVPTYLPSRCIGLPAVSIGGATIGNSCK
jgi:hypothetical protein